jgi:hypothetical protein
MSETQHEDLFDDEGNPVDAANPPTPAKLREALSKRKAENDELRKQNVELLAFKRDTGVKQFVKDKKLPEKAIGLIGDKDPEKWYEEFGELFTPAGNEGSAGQEAESTTTAPVGQGALTPEEQAAIAAVGSVQAGSFTPGSDAETTSKLDSLESTAKSPDEFYAGLREMGAAS